MLHSMVCLISSDQPIHVFLLAFVEHYKEDSIAYLNITDVLEDYSDTFAEPTGLPPPHSHDHKIPRVLGASPTNI